MKKINIKILDENIKALKQMEALEKDKSQALIKKDIIKLDKICITEEKLIPEILRLDTEKNAYLESDLKLNKTIINKITKINRIKMNIEIIFSTNKTILKDFKELFEIYFNKYKERNTYTKNGSRTNMNNTLYSKKI